MEPARRPKQARGEARREHILRATLAAIGERGIEGVTHRAIAARARVPLGSLTYYFPSKEDLLGQALLLFVDEEVERLEALGERLGDAGMEPAEIADAFATALEANDPVAQFELYLEASRTPALRSAAADCLRAYRRCAEIALRAAGVEEPERSASLFVALVDGLSLQRKAAPDAVPDLREALLDLFGRVTAAR
jgi:DNA-binding transcriptional regulator YbjK